MEREIIKAGSDIGKSEQESLQNGAIWLTCASHTGEFLLGPTNTLAILAILAIYKNSLYVGYGMFLAGRTADNRIHKKLLVFASHRQTPERCATVEAFYVFILHRNSFYEERFEERFRKILKCTESTQIAPFWSDSEKPGIFPSRN